MTPTPEPCLTVEQVAAQLILHPKTLLKLVRRGEITAVRVGRRLRFTREQVAEYLRRNELQPPAPPRPATPKRGKFISRHF